MKVFIYTLSCPTTGLVRYVGKTTRLKRRYLEHCNKNICSKRKNHKNDWCLSILTLGLKPTINTIDIVGSDWREAEIKWILHFKKIGCDLVNNSLGGEGANGRKLTQSHKNKISIASRNSKLSEQDIISICDISNNGGKYLDAKKIVPIVTARIYYSILSGIAYRRITEGRILYSTKNNCNRRRVVYISGNIRHEYHSITEASKVFGVTPACILYRIKINKNFYYN